MKRKYTVRHYVTYYYCEDHVVEATSRDEAESIAHELYVDNVDEALDLYNPYDEEHHCKVVKEED